MFKPLSQNKQCTPDYTQLFGPLPLFNASNQRLIEAIFNKIDWKLKKIRLVKKLMVWRGRLPKFLHSYHHWKAWYNQTKRIFSLFINNYLRSPLVYRSIL